MGRTDDPAHPQFGEEHAFSSKSLLLKSAPGRVRRVVTRSGKHFRGKFPSRKCRRMVHWESFLERDAIRLLEYHPAVLSYWEQPSIELYYDEKHVPRRYIPDLEAVLTNGTTLHIEVKPTTKLALPETAAKYRQIACRYCELSRPFRLLTEIDLWQEPRASILKLLHKHNKTPLVAPEVRALMRLLGTDMCWSFADVCERVGLADALRLIGAGELRIRFDRPLESDAPVWSKQFEGENHDSVCL